MIKEHIFLALLIINKGGMLSNEYWLCKGLRRPFQIVNCSEIINEMVKRSYVEYKEVKGVRTFCITKIGFELMLSNKVQYVEKLKEEYGQDNEMLNALIESLDW